MPASVNENTVEYAAIEWLPKPWEYRHGETDIGPEGTMPERRAYDEVILQGRLRDALTRINPHIPAAQRETVWEGVLATIRRAASQNVVQNNDAFHRLLTEGVDVQWQAAGDTGSAARIEAGAGDSRGWQVVDLWRTNHYPFHVLLAVPPLLPGAVIARGAGKGKPAPHP